MVALFFFTIIYYIKEIGLIVLCAIIMLNNVCYEGGITCLLLMIKYGYILRNLL